MILTKFPIIIKVVLLTANVTHQQRGQRAAISEPDGVITLPMPVTALTSIVKDAAEDLWTNSVAQGPTKGISKRDVVESKYYPTEQT